MLWGALAGFIVAVYIAGHYNHLVMLKHNIQKAWANIDVLLKQRNEELTKLAAVCRRYMSHEQQLLEHLTKARDGATLARERNNIVNVIGAEARVQASVQQLLLRAEAYPQLHADQALGAVTTRIAELEKAIAARREFYNESVRIGNASIEQFPGSIYARLFNFHPADYFERTEANAIGSPANG